MPSEFWPSQRPGYLLIRALQWHIFYLTKVIKAKTMNEHVTRILSLNYKTHLVEFVTPTCLVGSLEVKIILIRQTNVLFLVSAFLRGSLNAMVSSPSHFWNEVRRGRTEPLCYRISGIVGFAIPWAVLRIPKPRIPDSTSKIVPDSTFPMQKITGFQNPNSLTWGETRQKLNSKKLAHFSQVNHFHPGYFKYKKHCVTV